ncbi:sensor histidine kinase [Corynebacterium kutscheri]|uniref:sensor histidine kinase n=1 Tax=Corynebacterium kutscheri TaxID=35755 RepID=UPI000F81E78E|nr:HAMP domain-containing sensor histidine kinase [Corynebacterium kutscheri]
MVVAITGMGLFSSALIVQEAMESVIFGRIDDNLEHALDGWAAKDDLFLGGNISAARPPNDYFVVRVDISGTVQTYGSLDSYPDFDSIYVDRGPQTVDSGKNSTERGQWRAIAISESSSFLVVAKQINQEFAILHRLAVLQWIIGIAVLVALGLVAFWLLNRTLIPLRGVERTAQAIARGELDSRVPGLPENTEVGSLAKSFNMMLEKLQHTVEELRGKEEQMRRFVGDASHELRTPLTSVKGYAELYRSGATSDANMVINKIGEEATRMSLLVEDLLALTRSEGARYDEAPVDLLELSLAVASSLKVAYPERTINVRPETDGIPMVIGDVSRLHQVLANLSVNALTHGGDDAEVTIRLRDDDKTAIIEVIDNGVGMDVEDSMHIFERFYRADTSRTRATGGSGLGLAIVKSIVESHGGEVTVDSIKGEGTTFMVRLPLIEEKQ